MCYYVINIKLEQHVESAELCKVDHDQHLKLIVQLLGISAVILPPDIACHIRDCWLWQQNIGFDSKEKSVILL